MDRMLSGEHPFGAKDLRQLAGVVSRVEHNQDRGGKICRKICHECRQCSDTTQRNPTATKRPIAVAQVAAALLLSFREGYAWRPARRTAGGGLAGQTSLSASQ